MDNRKRDIELCRQAGFDVELKGYETGDILTLKLIELVRQDERERCAKVIENECHDDMTRAEEAAAIRSMK